MDAMAEPRAILLTGATGFLGQYLLQELLQNQYPVAVLARDSRQGLAAERIGQIVRGCSDRLKIDLAIPTVLTGDLDQPDLGLSAADRSWLARNCRAVLHSAANLSFQETAAGEPWRTNVAGTESLLQLCANVGIAEFHHISTAFVCGKSQSLVTEAASESAPEFHNVYEESKFQAEHLVRRSPGVCATIYRPSVIVGASDTGHTSSFTGFYRFLEMGVRLAQANCPGGEGHFPLRLPLCGDEPWNLVCVDWVARAVVQALGNSHLRGHTFHLVNCSPTTTRLIRDVGAELLNLRGVEFAGSREITNPTSVEEAFLTGIEEYWPYLFGSPQFDSANAAAAFAAPPVVDRRMLERLIGFAIRNRWGRTGKPRGQTQQKSSQSFSCTRYMEEVFPAKARNSRLAREAGLDLIVSIKLGGREHGQWSCQWRQGELVQVQRGLHPDAVATFTADSATFEAIVFGRQTPQEAFFEQRISIAGELEIALKLVVLLGQFLAENPVAQPQPKGGALSQQVARSGNPS
jgi:thioester reductase-like protein